MSRPAAAPWAPDRSSTGTNIHGAEVACVAGLVQPAQTYICGASAPQFLAVKDPRKWYPWCRSGEGAPNGACALEWVNERPGAPLRELGVELTSAGAAGGLALLGLTAYE